ncbi:MAG: RNA polymerase sigma factor [Verrucomicrobia bacterium]|nr:RNA polymerase sigma factor [Verrucomicrobiota bacterium]
MNKLETTLIENLEQFTAFARSRVNSPEMAADIVQESLLKALKSADQLREDENVVAWFYKILRHSIIDLYRRTGVKDRALELIKAESDANLSEEETNAICKCLDGLIPTLKPEYGALIRQIDLSGEPLDKVARALNITTNNLNVRLHRARHQLKERLEQTCQMCSKHGCLNCTCDSPDQ